jgi:hypothetical protein
VLAAIEGDSPGISNKVMSARTKEGAVDIFEASKADMEAEGIPYSMSLAVGPGETGTVLAAGRAETVKSFLKSGAGAHRMPEGVSGLLPKPGQVWFYQKIPADVSKKVLESGAPGIKDNPMASGIVKSMDQVSDFALNLSFGAAAVNVEAAIGCRSVQAAKEMADGIQGFIGMMQLMAGQDPAATPPFLTQLRVKSDGSRFRLTTALGMKDVQLLKQATAGYAGGTRSGSASASASSAPSGKATVVVDPLVTPGKPPVTLEFLGFVPDPATHIRRGKFRISSSSDRAVRELRITFRYQDNRGATLGEWTRNQRDSHAEVLVTGGAERVVEIPLFNLPAGTTKVAPVLHEVSFTEGERWTARP